MDHQAAIRQAEQDLMSKPNVTGVGIGERDGKTVIKVFVTRKVMAAQLRADELIPATCAGYETDVVEIGEISTQ